MALFTFFRLSTVPEEVVPVYRRADVPPAVVEAAWARPPLLEAYRQQDACVGLGPVERRVSVPYNDFSSFPTIDFH